MDMLTIYDLRYTLEFIDDNYKLDDLIPGFKHIKFVIEDKRDGFWIGDLSIIVDYDNKIVKQDPPILFYYHHIGDIVHELRSHGIKTPFSLIEKFVNALNCLYEKLPHYEIDWDRSIIEIKLDPDKPISKQVIEVANAVKECCKELEEIRNEWLEKEKLRKIIKEMTLHTPDKIFDKWEIPQELIKKLRERFGI